VTVAAPAAEPKEASVHSLPCEIKYTGLAPVNTYFKPHQSELNGPVEAAFRGRDLRGREVRLADHQLSGWLLKDTVQGAHASLECAIGQRQVVHCIRCAGMRLLDYARRAAAAMAHEACPCRGAGSIADGEQRRWVAAGTFSSLMGGHRQRAARRALRVGGLPWCMVHVTAQHLCRGGPSCAWCVRQPRVQERRRFIKG
jgi:hypothetical protein